MCRPGGADITGTPAGPSPSPARCVSQRQEPPGRPRP
jgi:hypothetical protein